MWRLWTLFWAKIRVHMEAQRTDEDRQRQPGRTGHPALWWEGRSGEMRVRRGFGRQGPLADGVDVALPAPRQPSLSISTWPWKGLQPFQRLWTLVHETLGPGHRVLVPADSPESGG